LGGTRIRLLQATGARGRIGAQAIGWREARIIG